MSYYRLIVILCLFTGLFSPVFSAQNPRVVLETNFGNIVIELYPEEAPITVDNVLNYVNSGFYDYLLFHRVIYGFMIQTGRYFYHNGDYYYREPGDPIINESYNGLSNLRGTISMARLGADNEGNPQPDSATSQFFINHRDNLDLDRNYPDGDGYGYCVFGKVIEGMDVVDSIAVLPVIQTSFSEAFPNDPMAGIYQAYVLPCEVSYCGNLASGSQISFSDFAVFASRWLDVCGSDNGFCNGADLNYSGGVDIADLELFIEHWSRTVGYEPVFSDLVPSGGIDLNDLLLLMTHWLDADCNEENVYCGGADIDHGGTVDFADFFLFSNNWLVTY